MAEKTVTLQGSLDGIYSGGQASTAMVSTSDSIEEALL